MKTKSFAPSTVFAVLAVFLFVLSGPMGAQARESAFRQQFTEAKQQNNFAGMKFLVKENGAIIPAEIERIMAEANAGGVSAGERIYLLGLAYQLAKMHTEWNGADDKRMLELEAMLGQYRREAAARQAIRDRIKEVEIVPGNFVMNAHAKEMENAGLKPVIYPHWVHRSFFRCKVCHESLVIMRRGANGLSHEKIDAGELCGACHNGEISFDTTAEANCPRCHLFGSPRAHGLVDLSYYDEAKFTETATRLGGKWHGDRLVDGRFPLSKLGFINWVKLDELGAFEPLSSLGGGSTTEGIRDTKILFLMPKKYASMLDNVLWSHKIHTTWINCSICHESAGQRERIFEKKAGATRVSMIEIKEGKSCGTCHDRVSFHVSDCKRCHNHKGVEADEKTIVRESIEAPSTDVAPAGETRPKTPGIFKSSY